MEKKGFSETEITGILSRIDEGASVNEVSVEYDISLTTLYDWQIRHGKTDNLLKRFQELEEENYRLKAVLANAGMDDELTVTQYKLEELNKELEQEVLERTEQLESFTYSVSHDLRAPLRAISGFSKFIKEDYSEALKDPLFDDLIDKVVRNAVRMDALVTDLLNFSKIKNKVLSKTIVNMDNLVREIMHELTWQEGNRNLDIHISALEPILGDTPLIRQVWSNLISNALKFSGKKEISIIKINCSADNDMVCYSVLDNGAGFDMKFADKLFGVFQRLHSNSEFEGTGVGLALSKNIIDRHGGKIWAESEVGKGTTFYFTLPR